MNYFIESIKPLIINIAYNLLYSLSWCQIYVLKVKNYVYPKITYINSYVDNYLKDKGWIVDALLKELLVINNVGEEIYNFQIKDETDIVFIKNVCRKIDYSKLILLDKNAKTNCINYVFYKNVPDSFDYKLSNVKFIAIDLEYDTNKYMINLKDEDSNYYIVNNSLDEFFFKFYITNILNLDIDENTFNYNVTIIDNNINIINLSPRQRLVFYEDKYEIETIDNNADNVADNDSTNNTSTNNNNLSNLDSDNSCNVSSS